MPAVDARERFAKRRLAREMRALHEVNARVNNSPQLRVTAGLTASKTMHHGADLCGCIAKLRLLVMTHKFQAPRFVFGRCERGAVLLVDMPDGWRALPDWDDFVYPLAEFEHKVLETSDKGGLWEAVDVREGA